MKIGRNDPCPCGSGLKYKKCCINKKVMNVNQISMKPVVDPHELAMVRAEMEKKMGPEPNLHIVPSVVWKGYRWRFIWSRVHWRPIHETFHEFILNILLQTFGEEWRKQQMALPEHERHVLIRWVRSYESWRQDNEQNRDKFKTEQHDEHTWSAVPSGDVQALLQFAYDAYCLAVVRKLPDFLIKKVKNRNDFQGARYEIAVAAMITRAGFDIEFLDDKRGQGKSCEFIATHKTLKIKYGVEAKSRRRSGVVHEAGAFDQDKNFKGDVDNLFKKAIAQRPEKMPFLIFIDLNLPQEPHVQMKDKKWFPDIKKMFDDRPIPTEEKPEPFNALFITNFAYYYAGEGAVAPAGESLAIISLHPENRACKDANEDIEILKSIYESIGKYAVIPREV